MLIRLADICIFSAFAVAIMRVLLDRMRGFSPSLHPS
jgi:hypothetical protein